MDVADCHQAISEMLLRYGQYIDDTKIAISGASYGGFIGSKLALEHPDKYDVIVLQNPLLDLSAVFGSGYVENLLGQNFTSKDVETPEEKADAWERSPLSQAQDIRANTLIFVGGQDKGKRPVTRGTISYLFSGLNFKLISFFMTTGNKY